MRLLRSRTAAVLPRPRRGVGGRRRRSARRTSRSASRGRRRRAAAPQRFDLVGLHWQGTGTVLFRTRSLAGRWSAWQRAAPEDEDQPDRGSREARARAGWRLGNPYWVGPSDRLALARPRRRAPAARLVRLEPGRALDRFAPSPWPARRRSSPRAGVARERRDPARRAALRRPRLLLGRPPHGRLEHATRRRSRRRSSAAIELYHVKGNGWNDIGYNFLVDKYGQVFEGRIGGIERNVVGAHAEGFNHGLDRRRPARELRRARRSRRAAERALVQLLAWRLDVAHVDPLSLVNWSSGGNPKYPLGTHVKLRAISGHRDTGFTSCPGTRLYAKLPSVAEQVAATGLPKLYAPTVKGSLGGPIVFTARLSAPAAWTVTVRNAAGKAVAGRPRRRRDRSRGRGPPPLRRVPRTPGRWRQAPTPGRRAARSGRRRRR